MSDARMARNVQTKEIAGDRKRNMTAVLKERVGERETVNSVKHLLRSHYPMTFSHSSKAKIKKKGEVCPHNVLFICPNQEPLRISYHHHLDVMPVC